MVDSKPISDGNECGDARTNIDTIWANVSAKVWSDQALKNLQQRNDDCRVLDEKAKPLSETLSSTEQRQLKLIQEALVEGNVDILKKIVASKEFSGTSAERIVTVLNAQMDRAHSSQSAHSEYQHPFKLNSQGHELAISLPVYSQSMLYGSTDQTLEVTVSETDLDARLRPVINRTFSDYTASRYPSNRAQQYMNPYVTQPVSGSDALNEIANQLKGSDKGTFFQQG